MITSYYTLRALVREWTPDLTGCVVGDAFSQVRDELTLALARPDREWMLRISVRAPLHFIFRSEGYSRARRNVAALFEGALDRRVSAVRLAERDRMLYLDLEGGGAFQVMLFGPRPNVFLVDAAGIVLEAFQAGADWVGREAPAPRPAPQVETFAAFEARWRADRKTIEQALAAALPLFDRTLAAEAMHRAGVPPGPPSACREEARHRLFEAAAALRAELKNPSPRIYWRGPVADLFSLVALQHRAGQQAESFDTVDDAVRVFVRRALAQQRFRQRYDPLERALAASHARHQARAERMLEELSSESRAERYERWGHLLMAAAADVPRAADEVTLPDLFAGGEPVRVPLDPLRTPVENAQRYYEKARRTRQARAYAEARLLEAEALAQEAGRLLEMLRGITTRADLEAFVKAQGALLARFAEEASAAGTRLPFRRFQLEGGYEVWVGKTAKQNDLLTFRYAQKHDVWMHARGVAGSHTVLRLPSRQARPSRSVLEHAASIAAYYSKAQGSSLVPVMMAARKYVRKPKGAPPGAVLVEREEVLLVEPRLPHGEEGRARGE